MSEQVLTRAAERTVARNGVFVTIKPRRRPRYASAALDRTGYTITAAVLPWDRKQAVKPRPILRRLGTREVCCWADMDGDLRQVWLSVNHLHEWEPRTHVPGPLQVRSCLQAASRAFRQKTNIERKRPWFRN